MRWICRTYLSVVPIEHKYFFIKAVQVLLGFWWKRTPFMKEMHRILKFTNMESSTFEKGFLCTSDRIFFIGDIIFTWLNFFRFQKNLKVYSGKPDISFEFNSDKNIILKRENLKTKELYVRHISNRINTN